MGVTCGVLPRASAPCAVPPPHAGPPLSASADGAASGRAAPAASGLGPSGRVVGRGAGRGPEGRVCRPPAPRWGCVSVLPCVFRGASRVGCPPFSPRPLSPEGKEGARDLRPTAAAGTGAVVVSAVVVCCCPGRGQKKRDHPNGHAKDFKLSRKEPPPHSPRHFELPERNKTPLFCCVCLAANEARAPQQNTRFVGVRGTT